MDTSKTLQQLDEKQSSPPQVKQPVKVKLSSIVHRINDENDSNLKLTPSSRDNDSKYKSNDKSSPLKRKLSPSIQSSIHSNNNKTPIKTREDLIKIQNTQRGSQQRNKRMFGLLVGTLQQFKNDDSERSTTDNAQHRREVEKKIEIKKAENNKKITEEKNKLDEAKRKSFKLIEIQKKKTETTEQVIN
jgi:pinin